MLPTRLLLSLAFIGIALTGAVRGQTTAATTGVATAVTATTVVLNGTVNPGGNDTSAFFEYGTDTTYGSSTPDQALGAGLDDIPVTDSATGLTASTQYHFRVVAMLDDGSTIPGDDQTFTTPASTTIDPAGNAAGALPSDASAAGTTGTTVLVQPSPKDSPNTSYGFGAFDSNTTGADNTGYGYESLHSNTTGGRNTAFGSETLVMNIDGSDNTALGYGALSFSDGLQNTGVGSFALAKNASGSTNTAIGYGSLYTNTGGSLNIAVGNLAGFFTEGSGNIDIGNLGVAGDDDAIRIGIPGTQSATYIAGISGVTLAKGAAVSVGTDGKLGVTTSSRRFKTGIEEMGSASEVLLGLQPVRFRYKKELDPEGVPQFGLVAEDVEKLDPDLIIRDDSGKPYTVRYEAVNAMLLNEFLKEHRKVDQQEEAMAGQQKAIANQKTTIEELQKQVQSLSSDLKEIEALVRKTHAGE